MLTFKCIRPLHCNWSLFSFWPLGMTNVRKAHQTAPSFIPITLSCKTSNNSYTLSFHRPAAQYQQKQSVVKACVPERYPANVAGMIKHCLAMCVSVSPSYSSSWAVKCFHSSTRRSQLHSIFIPPLLIQQDWNSTSGSRSTQKGLPFCKNNKDEEWVGAGNRRTGGGGHKASGNSSNSQHNQKRQHNTCIMDIWSWPREMWYAHAYGNTHKTNSSAHTQKVLIYHKLSAILYRQHHPPETINSKK